MPDVVDRITDFAVPDMKLFPCDTPSLTGASVAAFKKEASKLPAMSKIAAARHIAGRASEQGVSVGEFIDGSRFNPMFKVALRVRDEGVAWNSDALRQLNVIERVAGSLDNGNCPPVMLDKLAGMIEDFDAQWDPHGSLTSSGKVPDAIDTVFARVEKVAGGVDLGGRTINEPDLARLKKEAASKVLGPEAMKVAESWPAFVGATWVQQAAIASFIPEKEKA